MPNNEGLYDVTDEQGNTDTHTAESADTTVMPWVQTFAEYKLDDWYYSK
jgi:hypothetical protein